MRSRLSMFFLFSFLLLATLFISCQKEDSLTTDDSRPLTFRDPQSFTYSLDSAAVGDSVLITFDAGNGADCGLIHIQVSADGEDWIGGKPIVPDSGLATFVFLPEEPGTYAVRAKYNRTGKPSECEYESTSWLVAADSIYVAGDTTSQDTTAADSCESYFAGEVINCDSSNREVVFTFVSDEDLDHLKIQGGLTNGVQGDPTVTVTGADLDVTIKTPGHSSNRVITLQGSATACDTITVTLSWISNNNGSYITGDWSAYGMEVAELECE